MKRLVALASLLTVLPGAAGAQTASEAVIAKGNPILADGRFYTTDPAPLVDGDTLYILTGRDMADPEVNDFIMPEWQLLSTRDPASRKWRHIPGFIRPENVFAWAEPARAYAGQIVKGADGRFYFYAPVLEKDSDAKDRFAIGVAVADRPTGPWKDAHPSGPIISQKLPVANNIQNIDPTVLLDDDDGRVYIYWGTFGQLRGMELERDMITPKGGETRIEGLTGFFEAPWVLKRKGMYYMLYAGNKAGPDSACTPAVYYACQAWGTAASPFGPWTYRGVALRPVSSTTSHAGIVEFKGKWYMAYHTADAVGGGHFRRSVAIDEMQWDDSVSPAAIRPVVPTRAPQPAPRPTRNIASSASAVSSNVVPVQYWIAALNDGKVRANPLPPEMWGTWNGNNPQQSWVEYRWAKPVTVDGSRVYFFADQPAGSGIGVAPPAAWHLEYWDGAWKPVAGTSGYGTTPGAFEEVRFAPVTTRCLRMVFDASGSGPYAGVGVQEWEVLAPRPRAPAAPGVAAPACGKN
jgi:beta-xylosidase